jgi:hypothetical protein
MCKKHKVQDAVAFAFKGKINIKCSVCCLEDQIRKFKKIENEKYNVRFRNNGNVK